MCPDGRGDQWDSPGPISFTGLQEKKVSFETNSKDQVIKVKSRLCYGKLDNCVVIQVNAEEEDVLEHFCGISSDFVDNFEFPVEEVKVITTPKIPQYVLVLESSEGTIHY